MACACFKKMCKVCYPILVEEPPEEVGCETPDVLYAAVHPLKLDSYIQPATAVFGGSLRIPPGDVAEMKWFGKIQEALQEFTKIEGRALQRTQSHASEERYFDFSDQPMIDEVPVIKLHFSPGALQTKCSSGLLRLLPPGPGRGGAIWKYRETVSVNMKDGGAIWKYTQTVSVNVKENGGLHASIGTYKRGVETVVPDLMPRLLARRRTHDAIPNAQAQLECDLLTAFEQIGVAELMPDHDEMIPEPKERRGSKRGA